MPLYQDYSGAVFTDLPSLAEFRIQHQAPLLEDSTCPATEYTFAVSSDEGKTWHNPNDVTKEALRQAVTNQEGCCLNLKTLCKYAKPYPYS